MIYVIVGIRRSGIHAIQQYISDQLEGPVAVFNDMLPGRVYHNLWPEYKNAAHTIVTIEDCELSVVASSRIFSWLRPNHVMLLVRDPFNLFASRFKQLFDTEFTMPKRKARAKLMFDLSRAVMLYPQYIAEFLGQTNHLSAIPVSYNHWLSDRTAFGQKLNLPCSDYRPDKVLDIGGGSSFDGVALSGRAHEMKVLDRWRAYATKKRFLACLTPDIIRIGRELFGIHKPMPDAADKIDAGELVGGAEAMGS